ncbi:MAG TPA: hypothetical protein VEV65_11690 [Kineosporiaceae bacterium]|nr:hypothetical protein [Kineosporiaceae bacterium]
MSFFIACVVVALAVLLFVVPALVVLRDLRTGRRDPSWNGDGAM